MSGDQCISLCRCVEEGMIFSGVAITSLACKSECDSDNELQIHVTITSCWEQHRGPRARSQQAALSEGDY